MAGHRPLRVCFINPYGYPLFTGGTDGTRAFGGAEVQLYYLATGLARLPGFDVCMVVEGSADRIRPEAEGVRMLSVPPQPWWVDTVQSLIPFPAVPYQRAMRQADADVYLQRGGSVLTGDVRLFCRRAGRRFAFMVAHDWDCDHHHGAGWHRLKGWYYQAGLRGADLVYAQSDWQREMLRIHHGVDAPVFRSVHPDLVPGAAPRTHVLWVGRCVPWKRPLAFLDLARQFPETPFVMIAPGYPGQEELRAETQRRAAALGHVTLHDYLPFPQMADFFAAALAYVNTSDAEGFPNTFIQAARAAVPVISLRVDPDGLLGREGMGACAGGDTRRMAADLGHLLADGPARERCGQRGRAYFLRTHDLAAGVAVLRQGLERLAPEHRT
jgi:glycosyltransferase involved in cell wall biosynthesis